MKPFLNCRIAVSLVICPLLLLCMAVLQSVYADVGTVTNRSELHVRAAAQISQLNQTEPLSISNQISEVLALPLTATIVLTPLTTSALEAPVSPTDEPEEPAPVPEADDIELDEVYVGPLDGTIIANRSNFNVTFFVEGELFRLTPLRSMGIQLLRSTTVLNLFNCDADTPESQEGCFWDPYLIAQDGFYEIFNGAAEGLPLNLTLEEAGTPPTDQIWVQNRTGQREIIVFDNQTYELPPASVLEFSAATDDEVTFFLRQCLSLADQSVCEWNPQTVESGFYYALTEATSVGSVADSRITFVDLQPLLSGGGEIVASETAAEVETSVEATTDTENVAEVAKEVAPPPADPSQLVCRLQVPTLNIRSGPGLEYLVISQARSTGQEAGTVVVIGRDPTSQWLAVDERVAAGGWIIGGPNFMLCDVDIATLPIVEISDGRLAPPTPEPAPAVVEATEAGDGGEASDGGEGSGVESEETTPAQAVTVPKGQAVLVVTNAFEHVVRFTLSPEEYDLQPNQTVNIVVNLGRVQFSASSPWRGMSGNAEFFIEESRVFELYLHFVPDPDGSGEWEFRYQ